MERQPLRKAPTVERRTPLASVAQRSATASVRSPARALQQRLGNRAAQDLLARSAAGPAPASEIVAPICNGGAPLTVQCSTAKRLPSKVSRPSDPAELEAEEIARKVMRAGESAAGSQSSGNSSAANAAVAKSGSRGTVQRAKAAPPAASPAAPARVNISGGSPLPASMRQFMEPRFGSNFGGVRVHTGPSAAQLSAGLNANAFTVGQHIFFGKDKFQPQSAGGRELIAHELTHTIQQGATIQRDAIRHAPDVDVASRVDPHVQRWPSLESLTNPTEFFAREAANVPGFTMLTVVLGFNPINDARVERNAANILRGAINMLPGGALISDLLNKYGIFDKVAAWASQRFEELKHLGTTLLQGVKDLINKFSSDPTSLFECIEQGKSLVLGTIDRIAAFAKTLLNEIVDFVKEAILKPIAEFARTTRGYTLLSTVMGRDPISGEAVVQSAETLLGEFLIFIGEDEIWKTMQQAKAVPRAFAWFNGAVNALRGFVNRIPPLFVQTLKSLQVGDLLTVSGAFSKFANVFGGFAAEFVSWGANAAWTLLEIIFDVVSPGALAYIKKTGAALRGILRNPMPFVGNLVRAAKQGFQGFADRIVTHLKTGLIDWLTGSIEGVYIPQALSLAELGKFVVSILGLSWAQVRGKIVKALGASGETIMKGLESSFVYVKTLIAGGPAALWEMIKEKLTDLKEKVTSGIVSFVTETIVTKAIPKLIAMFIPGAGFVSAIVSIYDTIMVFVNKIKQIIAVVTGFIDSIVAIAAGQIGPAAARVENALAGVVSLAINFLAGFLGLGKVTDKIKAVVEKVRATVDKALDVAIGWIVGQAKKLFGALFGKKGGKPDERNETQKDKDKLAAIGEAEKLVQANGYDAKSLPGKLAPLKSRYKLASLDLVLEGKTDRSAKVHFEASASKKVVGKSKEVGVVAEFVVVTVAEIKGGAKTPSVIQHRPASAEAKAATPGQKGAATGWEVEVREQVSATTGLPLTPVPKGSEKLPKDEWPGGKALPSDPRLLSQPKTNIGGGRVAADPHSRPDLVAILPGAKPRIEVVEATLDANFMIPAGGKEAPKVTEPHKAVQLASSVFGISLKYPGVPIIYTIRCPKPPSDFAKKHINAELRSLKAGGIKVEVVWVNG
jgi:hypothetical protein